MKTILAAVDFSPVSHSVLKATSALAKALSARVVLVSVVIPAVVPADPSAVAVLTDPDAINAAAERHAIKVLAGMAADVTAEGPVETECLTGTPAPCILDHAAKIGADYIVVGSHGHGAFYDLVVGSTAQLILRRSTCPVVVVPAVATKKSK